MNRAQEQSFGTSGGVDSDSRQPGDLRCSRCGDLIPDPTAADCDRVSKRRDHLVCDRCSRREDEA